MKPSATLHKIVETALPDLIGLAWTPLTGGRTNHLWRVGNTVVKSYDAAQASPLFPNDAAAEALALRHFGPLGLAPRLAATGPGWIAYGYVTGTTWMEDPRPVAVMLHRLHASTKTAPPDFRQLASGSAALVEQTLQILARCNGTLPPLASSPDVPPHRNPVPIHADIVPGNLIDGPGGVTAIDWQCPAIGDPAEDLATFLSPAMQWLYRGRILTPEEGTAFLDAYPDRLTVERLHALRPAFRHRMAAHCLWRTERGDKDYEQALRLELA